MKVLEIKDITRKELPIYYRRLYTGVAVLDLAGRVVSCPLEFSFEQKPTGQVVIGVVLSGEVSYPLVPLQKELKNYLGGLDAGGKLPR